eukprot:6180050-Alexandrium_andersonii.AAC.1
MQHAKSPQALEPGTAQAPEGPQIGPRSCPGVHSAPCFSEDSESDDAKGVEGVRRCDSARSHAPKSAIR